MRTLDVVRHSLTRKGVSRSRGAGSHLSPEGVRLARRLGESMPDMAYVAVGDLPRHLETAIALGFAVDEQVAWPSGYVEGEVDHHDQWTWDQPFVRYAALLAAGRGLHDVAQEHLTHWRRVLDAVPEGGAALIVSSGGSIEPVLVAAFPGADHAAWGGPLHQLEGATIEVEDGRFTGITVRRGRP
ncbi:histidine phosphatase family protein [Promicromonospora sp. NPDC090134]|uniref:histidine phosphatase family protein n=1 Tax=Promicromonospora sp. NPDC090134 TaxID=3364408 RepID=UPI0037F116F4